MPSQPLSSTTPRSRPEETALAGAAGTAPLEVDPAAEDSWSESLRFMLTGKSAADLAAERRTNRPFGWLVPALLHAAKLVVGLVILWWGGRRFRIDPFWAYISMIVVGSETTGSLPAFLTRIFNT